ncbi:SNF2 family N-terminal domain-containing protein, partial [Pisolithus marmoratus]
MAAASQTPFPVSGGVSARQNVSVPKDKLSALPHARELKQAGHTPESSPDLRNLLNYIAVLNQQQQQYQQQLNSHPTLNGTSSTTEQTMLNGTAPQSIVSGPVPSINALRAQIQAFKLISRGQPIPEQLQQAIRPTNNVVHELEKIVTPTDVATRIVDAAIKTQKGVVPTVGSFYSTKHIPFRTTQGLLIPSISPPGLDVHQIINERDRFIEARVAQRIRELESWHATIADGGFDSVANDILRQHTNDEDVHMLSALDTKHPAPNAHGKLRAVIELKSLRLLEKQRTMRAFVAERLIQGTLLPLNRADFRRVRKPTLRDARMTEQAERRQRVDRERRAKHKHVEQLGVICAHGREVEPVINFHAYTEKEEQKRIERISKERLKALKADDEEAYMKLIDTAKDTRITHLLRQTDAYLDSLAQAVMAQQNEAGVPTEARKARLAKQRLAPRSTMILADEKGKVDYYAVAHRVSERITRQPVLLRGGTLKDYQLKGLQWMGLGKTIQTISLVAFLIESKKQWGPYLVIVPLSTMTNWSGEFQKWAPEVVMVSYKGNPTQRRNLQMQLRQGQFQVLLTTYEYIIKDRPFLSKIKWVHMIIDEGHRMKNTQSKLSQTLSQYYHSRYRLILTGTPLQNNLPELWSLLNFVLPKIFNSVKSFDEWFNTPFANSGTGDKIELNEEEALLIIRRLHKVLRPFLLRRLKKDVESELPDKVEKVIKVRMSALQSQLYKQVKKYKMIADGKDQKGKTGGVKGLSNELMQLRKICQHPFLFESVEDKINPGSIVDDKLIQLLSRVLPKFFATGHRVLIFFQMTKVMDIMEDFLKMMNWKYFRLDGSTKTEERAAFVQQFNAENSDIHVFILSTRAGGLGLNLQTADTVIMNPHADLQAQDRAHRIGQTKAVRILRFITEKSVEEAMYARARFKLDIDDKVIQAGRFDNKSTQEEQEEFLRSILEADQEEENEEAGDMNDEELNEIIARDDKELEGGHRGRPPPSLMQLEELPDCYQTDEPFEAKDIEDAIEGRGQRRRNVVNYNDGLSDEQAVEDGEDLQELADRTRGKKERRLANRLLKESETPGRSTPASETGGRKNKKGKGKAPEYDPPAAAGKRKRGNKAMSATPSVNEEEDDDRDSKRRKTKAPDLPPVVKEKMKKAFNDVYKAVLACEDGDGRKRCELFRELPDKRDYPDYYQLITQPYCPLYAAKTITQFKEDWKLMFDNARTYNREGSWVYVDAEEMEKVFFTILEKVTAGSGLPGASPSALTPMEEDERPQQQRGRPRGSSRRQIMSEDEYLTPSDEET